MTTETRELTMQLRFIEKRGRAILQQRVIVRSNGETRGMWVDVPYEREERK